MTAHCFGALSQVRVIGHCVIGQEHDLLFPVWLNCVREIQRLKYKFSSHPKTLEPRSKCGVIGDKCLLGLAATDADLYLTGRQWQWHYLTHWGLVTPYGIMELCQHWFQSIMACCLLAPCHYPNQTLTNQWGLVAFTSGQLCRKCPTYLYFILIG